MRLIVPYVRALRRGLRAEVIENMSGLHDALAPVEWMDLGPSQTAYAELWRQLWRDGEDFLIVEMDVVVPHAVLESMADCHAPWCRAQGMTLGCTLLRSEAMTAAPDLFPAESLHGCHCGYSGHHDCWTAGGQRCWAWHVLDRPIDNGLRRAGLVPCVHGAVSHLHGGRYH